MKKSIVLIIILSLFLSCIKVTTESKDTSIVLEYGRDIDLVVIDSCEYYYYCGTENALFTHKGNCVYCQERLEKMIRKYQNK